MFQTNLQPFIHWIMDNPNWAGLIVFAISLAESIAVVGLFVPGVVMMTAIGALIGSGALSLWPTMCWAVLGAIVGDTGSYFLGNHFHDTLTRIWPFRQFPHWLEHGKQFFHRHGKKSILLGRFIGPMRPFTPVIAGMLDMPRAQFFASAIIAAIFWAPMYSFPGMLVGASLDHLQPEIMARLSAYLLAFLAVCWLVFNLTRACYRPVHRLFSATFDACWSALPERSKLRQCLLRKADPLQRGQVKHVFWLVVMLSIFVYTVYCQLTHTGLYRLNDPAFHLFRSIRLPHSEAFMTLLTFLGSKHIFYVSVPAVALWLIYQRAWVAMVHWLTYPAAALMIKNFIKYQIQNPRPGSLVVQLHGYSFPSGHTTLSVLIYSLFAVYVAEALPRGYRWICYSCSTLLITAIVFSRPYLGAHWLLDIIAGTSLGIALLCAALLTFRRLNHRHYSIPGLMIFFIFGTCFGLYQHAHLQWERETHAYHLAWPQYELSDQTLQDAQFLSHHAQRFGVFGKQVDKFNLFYLGELAPLKAQLTKEGWHELPALTLRNSTAWFAAKPAPESLPRFPHIHRDRRPVLSMVKTHDGKHYAVHLWGSDFKSGSNALWIGDATEIHPYHPLPFITVYGHDAKFDQAEIVLFKNSLPQSVSTSFLRLKTKSLDWPVIFVKN